MTIQVSVGINTINISEIIIPVTIKDGKLCYPSMVNELTSVFGFRSQNQFQDFVHWGKELNPLPHGSTLVVPLGRSNRVRYEWVMYYLDLGEGLVQTVLNTVIQNAADYDFKNFAIPLLRCDTPFDEDQEIVARYMLQEFGPVSHLFNITIALDASKKKALQYFKDQGIVLTGTV